MSVHVCRKQLTAVCGFEAHYSTVEKAPIISPAHVFEEVEVGQQNAKHDLSGLKLSVRQFSLLLILFLN